MSKSARRNSTSRPSFTWQFGLTALLFWTVYLLIRFKLQANTELGVIDFGRSIAQWFRSASLFFPEWPALLRHCKRFAIVGAMSAVILATGLGILSRMGVEIQDIFEEMAIGFGLGYGVWGSVLFVAGLAGLWHRTALIAALALGLIPASIKVCRFLRRSRAAPQEDRTSLSLFDLFCLAGSITVWLYFLRYALVPETFYDALEYHLALPQAYLLHQRIIPMPGNSYSGTPGLPWMIYGWTMALDSWGISASLLHSTTMIWLACGFFGCCRKIGRPKAGLAALTAFSTIPVVIAECYRTSVHLEWALLELCYFISLLSTAAAPQGSPARRKWLVVAATFLGFCMCTKYPAWLLPITLLPLVWPSIRTNDSSTETSSGKLRLGKWEAFYILTIAGIWLAPWVLKNIWFYHNPIFPFFQERFYRDPDHLPDWRQINPAGTNIGTLFTLNGLLFLLSFPFRFLNPPDGVMLSIGPVVLAIAPILFFTKGTAAERVLSWLCVGLWLPLAALSSETRFFIPHLALYCVLICCAIERADPLWIRRLLKGALCAVCLAVGVAWMAISQYNEKREVFLGRKSFSEYLGHSLGSYATPPYAGIEFVNRVSRSTDQVLLLGDARSFYLQRKSLSVSADQPSQLESWADRSGNAEELSRRVQSANIGYVIVNFGELVIRALPPRASAKGQEVLRAFWDRYASQEFIVKDQHDRWVGVYRILRPDSPPRTSDRSSEFLWPRKL